MPTRYSFWQTPLIFLLTLSYSTQAQKLAFTSNPVNRVAQGSTYQYSINVVDSTNQRVVVTCNKIPNWIQFNSNNNTLSGTANKAGQYAIEIQASTNDTTIKQQFILTVFDTNTRNILPLGNSITNGTDKFNSYRRALWNMLHRAHYNFDFVGSWSKHHMGGEYPNPDFDLDHEGHSGWTAHHVLEPPDWDKHRGNIDQWLASYTPDMVLMEFGTNEVFQCVNATSAMNDFSIIIDKLRAKNPAVKILLAQIPPLGKQWAVQKLCKTDTAYGQAVKIFNEAIVEFAGKKSTRKSPVILIDQFKDVDPASDMYDDIHPNEKGELKMAERWYEAVKPFLSKVK
jgi:acyl-CoA thioesterase I